MSLNSKVYTAPFCATTSFQSQKNKDEFKLSIWIFPNDAETHTTVQRPTNNKLLNEQNEQTKEGSKGGRKEVRNGWIRDRKTTCEDVLGNQYILN